MEINTQLATIKKTNILENTLLKSFHISIVEVASLYLIVMKNSKIKSIRF